MNRQTQSLESMDVKDLIDTFDIRWFGIVHDRIEEALRIFGITVFKIEKTQDANIWHVQAYLRGAGNLGCRLDFVRHVRPCLVAARIVSRKTEIVQFGSAERVTISFIYDQGEVGGICYRRRERGRLLRCREEYFHCKR